MNKVITVFTAILFLAILAVAVVKLIPSASREERRQEQMEPTPGVSPTLSSIIDSIAPSPSLKLQPTKILPTKPQPTKIQPTVTATPTPKPTATPTPTPRTPNPPIMNISYPSDMQNVEFTSSSQKLCVVDTPAGGDTSGLQRKHSINDGSWSSYSDPFTLCFDPKEGLNRFQVQYRNGYGDESAMYTRQFNFHMTASPTP